MSKVSSIVPRLLLKSARMMATMNAPAAERNKDHILKVLTQYIQYDKQYQALEVASDMELSEMLFNGQFFAAFPMACVTMDPYSADKNKEHILKVLTQYVEHGHQYQALEVASGTGQHVVHFAQHLPNVSWQPSDCDQPSLSSLEARIKSSGVKNVAPPIVIDASQPSDQWGGGILQPGSFDIMTNVNMIHIAPWQATQGLFKGAGVLLKEGGVLLTYGPYMIDGTISPESNVRFDQTLKARCADWGLRDTAVLKELAKQNHLHFETMHDVPANNKMLVFRKKSST